MSLTVRTARPVRLRTEGRAVIMSIPAPVREELTLKAGDLVIVVAHEGYLMARKVDLLEAARLMAVKSTYL